MKTSLFQLIFNIAFVRFPKITEYLGQYQLQRIRTNILHRTSIRVFHFTKPTVTDIESCPKSMSREFKSGDKGH